MARQKKSIKKDMSEKDYKGTNRARGTGRGRSNRSTSKRKGASFEKDNTTQIGRNPIVEHNSIETPVGVTRSIVFPTDSASMQSFGNFTTSPGQDNYITQFNEFTFNPSDPGGYAWSFNSFNDITRRACNAMALGFCPLFGSTDVQYTGTWLSPLQLAATNLKQYIDTSFGTQTDYDPQDLMIYLMGVYAVFPMIAEIKRDIRLVMTYQSDIFPKFVPEGLFALLRIADEHGNYQNGEGLLYAAKHLRQYIDELNQLIITFNRLPMPPDIQAFGYNDDLFDAIYMDTPDYNTAQLYCFYNSEYWIYDEDNAEVGAQLTLMQPANDANIGAKLVYLSAQITRLSALRTSSNAMLQNLFNAFGSKDSVHVPTLDVNNLEPLPFVYNEQLLEAITNMMVCPASCITISHVVPDHESGNIISHQWINEENVTQSAPYIVNLPLQYHKDFKDVTQEDVGWSMRFHPIFLNKKKIPNWSAGGTGELITVMTNDTYSPFAMIRTCYVAFMTDSGITIVDAGNMRSKLEYHWNMPSYDYISTLSDFKAHEIPVFTIVTWDTTDLTVKVDVLSYMGERDVEATYRLADIRMFWTYLTLEMWAGNINRNVIGTRTRYSI